MMKKRYVAAAALALFLLTSCGNGDNKKAQGGEENEVEQSEKDITLTAKQIKTVEIKLGKIEQKILNSVIRVNGQTALDPQYQASVSSLASGIIRSITVTEGNRVGRGQVVAYLENTEIVALQRDYLSSVSEVQAAEQELSRQQELARGGAGVQKNLQQAQANYRIAKAKTMGTGKQLTQLGVSLAQVRQGKLVTRIPVTSPITGYVDKVKVNVGGYVDMQTPIMSIVDNSRLHCDLNVFEKDMAIIKTGMEVEMQLTNNPDERIKGVIDELNASFSGSTKSVIAHVKITDKAATARLMPDMYLTGIVNTGKQTVSALPKDAIASNEGKQYIFMLNRKDGTGEAAIYHFSRIEVATGASELGYTQVTPLTEIPANAAVVTAGAFYLSSMLGGGEEE